jgi:CO/xanthine dehydrogenase FAD-binding subunit
MQRATSLDDALGILAGEPGAWMPFAGGTDLMVLMEAGRLPKRRFVSLWNVNELRGVEVTEDVVRIGALATYSDLLADATLQREFPLVCAAARETGAIAIQNRGTVGGNIANGSPAADLPPALLVYDAAVHVASVRGRRVVAYGEFHKGYKVMDLAADELIIAVTMPRGREGWAQTYRKVGTRRAQAISKVCFAAAVHVEGDHVTDVRIALGSVAPTVIRCTNTEETLRGKTLDAGAIERARTRLGREIQPIDDIRSNARYRRMVSCNLLGEFLSGVRS